MKTFYFHTTSGNIRNLTLFFHKILSKTNTFYFSHCSRAAFPQTFFTFLHVPQEGAQSSPSLSSAKEETKLFDVAINCDRSQARSWECFCTAHRCSDKEKEQVSFLTKMLPHILTCIALFKDSQCCRFHLKKRDTQTDATGG